MNSEMCSLNLTHPTWSSGLQLGTDNPAGVRCLAQGSHLSRGHFLPEPGFEHWVTSGFKSNALSIRPRLVFDGQQVDVKLVAAGLLVCREPLVGVVDDVWCLSSPGPKGIQGDPRL